LKSVLVLSADVGYCADVSVLSCVFVSVDVSYVTYHLVD